MRTRAGGHPRSPVAQAGPLDAVAEHAGSRLAARAQLAQMFWLAVREVRLGDGVGVAACSVPSVWVVVP
jgi:hypothetical protein